MKDQDQLYISGVESGSYSWKRIADIGSALKAAVKALLWLCNFLFFLLWVVVEENAQRLTLCPCKQCICKNRTSWRKENNILSKQIGGTLTKRKQKKRQEGSLTPSEVFILFFPSPQEWAKAAESVCFLKVYGESLKDGSLAKKLSLAGLVLIWYKCLIPFSLHNLGFHFRWF